MAEIAHNIPCSSRKKQIMCGRDAFPMDSMQVGCDRVYAESFVLRFRVEQPRGIVVQGPRRSTTEIRRTNYMRCAQSPSISSLSSFDEADFARQPHVMRPSVFAPRSGAGRSHSARSCDVSPSPCALPGRTNVLLQLAHSRSGSFDNHTDLAQVLRMSFQSLRLSPCDCPDLAPEDLAHLNEMVRQAIRRFVERPLHMFIDKGSDDPVYIFLLHPGLHYLEHALCHAFSRFSGACAVSWNHYSKYVRA